MPNNFVTDSDLMNMSKNNSVISNGEVHGYVGSIIGIGDIDVDGIKHEDDVLTYQYGEVHGYVGSIIGIGDIDVDRIKHEDDVLICQYEYAASADTRGTSSTPDNANSLAGNIVTADDLYS